MGDKTGIAWTDASWNPIRGCAIVSSGCTNCYAMKQAHRFSGHGKPYAGLTRLAFNGPVWTGEVRFIPEALDIPLQWRKPRRVFVNSMSDLFHEGLDNEEIAAVFGAMAASPQHTFQILTKRPERMLRWFSEAQEADPIGFIHNAWGRLSNGGPCCETSMPDEPGECLHDRAGREIVSAEWPLPNVWLGDSVEDQKTANERIPALLRTPAAVRFVSYEPALEAVDFQPFFAFEPECSCYEFHGGHQQGCMLYGHKGPIVPQEGLDWLIVGGESGPQAREFDLNWARSVVKQCRLAGVPVFVKQLGSKPVETGHWRPDELGIDMVPHIRQCKFKDSKAGDINEWPEDLKVRQFPS